MGLSSMKSLVRRSIQKKQLGPAVTSSQIVTWANEFLTDVMPHQIRKDARVISFREGVLKIATRTGSTNHYLRGFEEEMKNRMMEKFHDIPLTQVLFLINRPALEEAL